MNKIEEARKENNLTQEKLAKKVGVTTKTISKWENEQQYPTVININKLLKIFQKPYEAIFMAIVIGLFLTLTLSFRNWWNIDSCDKQIEISVGNHLIEISRFRF